MYEQKIHSWFDRSPSPKEIEWAANTLSRLPRGFLPLSIFHEVTRLVVTPTVELAPLREKDGALQVLLTQRPDDDKYWPGEWHIPGAVVLSSDEEGSFDSVINRIIAKELHGKVPMNTVPKLAQQVFHDIPRGKELDHVYYFKTDVEDKDLIEGRFFDVNDLPENTIDFHVSMIRNIVAVHEGAEPDLLSVPYYPSH